MIITKPTVVLHRESRLEYVLTPKPMYENEENGLAYYLAVNDGRVSSGQTIYRTPEELDKMFTIKK